PNLAPGNSLTITVEMTPAGTVAESAQKSATINAFNDKADTTVRDSVRATTTKLTNTQPDALIKKSTEPDSDYALDNVYQTTPSGDQIEAQTVAKGGKATYSVRIQNDGNTTRTFVVKATETSATRWTVTYKVGTQNITTAIKGTGRTTASLAPGAFEIITVDMTAPGTLAKGSSKSTTLRVFLTGVHTTVRDTVQATTTVGTSSLVYRDEEPASEPRVAWVVAPPATLAAGMNYAVSWEVLGGKAVSHTCIVMSADPEPTKNPMAMTDIQSGKPGVFKAWVPAPSKGLLYYQVVAIVDGKTYLTEVVYGAVK
ncbi:MAG: hypothetical protein HY318_10800, partial [Armatimonadetes bacterium]|nr:hypothetical protein [Armatimonadota bacterium]